MRLLEGLILAEVGDPTAGLALFGPVVRALRVALADCFGGDARSCGVVDGSARGPFELLSQLDALVQPTALPEYTAPAGLSNSAPPKPAKPATVSASAANSGDPLLISTEMHEHLQAFLAEGAEHLDAIERALLEIEHAPTDPDRINELFRPFHTIKGIAGFLHLVDVGRLTHEVETLLDRARRAELMLTPAHIDLLFAAVDLLAVQLAAIREYLERPTGEAVPQPDITEILKRLQQAAAGAPTAAWSAASAAEQMARPTGEALVAAGVVGPEVVQFALERQREEGQSRKLGEILVDMGTVSRRQLGRVLNQQASDAGERSFRVETSKVDLLVDTVGELVIAQAMVGQMACASGGPTGQPEAKRGAARDEALIRQVGRMSKIVRDLQAAAMALRMVPIGFTFQRMRRLVRDLAQKAGKPVEFVTRGEDAELDRTVIQEIVDPLVHLVRNAVDHGLEVESERSAAGKPRIGRLELEARQQGETMVIVVRDDGRGLDSQKLMAAARERGLLNPGEVLSESEAQQLILMAGFSTAREVTDVSGRGVGLDVVKRHVECLHGRLEIGSEQGRGTAITIRLPLTLAIIDGTIVRVQAERIVIPTLAIEQALRPRPDQLVALLRHGQLLRARARTYPLLHLGELFYGAERTDPCRAEIVLVRSEDETYGLVVDEVLGQQQVVIKPLSACFRSVQGVSGAAILGDGRVGLILEPDGLLRRYRTEPARSSTRFRSDEPGRVRCHEPPTRAALDTRVAEV